MHNIYRIILMTAIFLAGFAFKAEAQFKEGAFTQSYNEQADTTATKDTADKLFSIKELMGGLAHKNDLKIGTMFAGSVILPGSAQIYNRDYWKLPVIYGGIGALAGTGGYYLHRYNRSKKAYDTYMADLASFEALSPGQTYPVAAPEIDYKSKQTGTWLMAGAGLMYWGSLMDGVVSYQSDREPLPGRATLYSILLPGLGQIYNGELFKVPIYWGGMMVSVHCLMKFNSNYKRFKRIHNEATTDPNYSENISAETAVWYRDVYRRYRDYSIVATALVYLLQVIDANVFAYMHDFEVSDDISMNIEPAIIAPNNEYAFHHSTGGMNTGVGLRVGLRF